VRDRLTLKALDFKVESWFIVGCWANAQEETRGPDQVRIQKP
jgi:hypothetical protein